MPVPRPLTRREVLETRTALVRRTVDADTRFRALLGRPTTRPRVQREWHDLLLFVLAHPHSAHASPLATQALHDLQQAGVETAEATLSANLSLTLVRWLVRTSPKRVAVAWCDADPEVARDVVRTVLPPLERECVDLLGDLSAGELLAHTFGEAPVEQLAQLLKALDALGADDALASHLFATLGVGVCVHDPSVSRTWVRAPRGAEWWTHAPLRRTADVDAACDASRPARVRLTDAASESLIAASRVQLATLGRETDPVTHTGAVSLWDCGDGLRVALFALDAEHRLPFDSYVGFMAFRNGVPLAYGGAWIAPGRSKIGLNVFDAMRGGESAWCFAQLLRLYHHVYGVQRVEVENYQLGYGNAEGMRSGAYWFYYRLGFRPGDAALAREAEAAFAGLRASPAREVPRAVLRRLVAAGLERSLGDEPVAPLDTAALTLAVQRHVVRRYGGDRARAHTDAARRLQRVLSIAPGRAWSRGEHAALTRWCVALDAIPDLEQWSVRERRALAAVIRSKGGDDEARHQRLLRRHARLLEAWRGLTAAAEG